VSKNGSFDDVFRALKRVLLRHTGGFAVVHDEPDYYCLATKLPVNKGRPLMFAAVRTGKRYVSFHLVPVYMNAALKRSMSPALKKRMQGMGCFNFTEVDATLFGELAHLTAAGEKWLKGETRRLASGG
jgi:hypothetical protein